MGLERRGQIGVEGLGADLGPEDLDELLALAPLLEAAREHDDVCAVDIEVVIEEGVVLLRVEHFQQSR